MVALVQATEAPDDGRNDFDFWIGEWRVSHRRLKRRLADCTEWETIEGAVSTRKILGGLGNFDETAIDAPAGAYVGATLRLFDPKTRLWSIYWLDSRAPAIDTPMTGQFEDGIGLFHADESFEGRPIKVRFIWTPLGPEACRWEQAFSPDGGETWETNWVMAFSRLVTPPAA